MKVAVFGITGYLGIELINILSKRQDIQVVYTATSKEKRGEFQNASIALLALPANESLHLVPKLLSLGIKVIDLSGAYRLKKADSYPHYYGWQHPYPELLDEAVYGLSENNRDKISQARLIANPGCYATAINLGLLPLAKAGLTSSKIIVRAISGYTGAGKGARMPKTITPYKGGRQHQHIPEIEQELHIENQLLFYPQIAPWPRGIEVIISLKTSAATDVTNLYENDYAREYFVRVKQKEVLIDDVINTNFCGICVYHIYKDSFLTIKVVIDNLIKGGAGQAVQNLNLVSGLPDNAGL